MIQPLIALVDCNNFYVSCERVFRPDLLYQPVAVLSNNDGCIVARSQEVKDLGIKMATPVHQIKHLIKRHQIHLFSSNYTLYADLSSRVMQSLEAYSPHLEVYSIDESFLDLTGLCSHTSSRRNSIDYALQIKAEVFQNTGIPVCVGLAPTKTLAKLANYAAKKWHKTGGVLDLSDTLRRDKLLPLVPVNEVWGVGKQTTKRLHLMGIFTAHDLASQSVATIQSHFNIVLARTVQELNGIACLDLESIAPDKQQIVCSRSFKRRLTDEKELIGALTCFAQTAAEKLRHQESVAGSISVSIRTNPLSQTDAQYQRSGQIQLKQPTNDTRHIVRIAKRLLKEIFKLGYRYQKCSLQLGHIQPETQRQQMDLFSVSEQSSDSSTLMNTVDHINRRFPKAIAISAAGINNDWQTPVNYLSPRYTTDWDSLPGVT